MMRAGIEPLSPGPLVNTQLIRQKKNPLKKQIYIVNIHVQHWNCQHYSAESKVLQYFGNVG